MQESRKKRVTKPRLQFRMIGMFLAISGFAALGQVLLLGQSLMNLEGKVDNPEVARAVQEALPGMLANNLMWTALFLVPFTLIVGIHMTHRVAGPASRIEKHLADLADGAEPKTPCFLRKEDELKELAGAMNNAFVRLSTPNQPSEAQTAGA
ncbi:MAG: hypothetical protein KDB61_00090 [Planctomycetes bacterium]|nr:hypothetical protein [Planctomycetota bacterium]